MSGRATPPPAPRPNRLLIGLALVGVAAMSLWSARGIRVSISDLLCNLPGGRRLLAESWPPEFGFLPRLAAPLLETLQIAVVGTVLGGLLAVPVAVLAARNLSPWRLLWFADRNVMNVIRTLPDLFWAMLFAAAVGFGPMAGALALTVFTVAVVAKLWSESLEAIDMGLPEAVQASGGSWLQMLQYGAISQVLPQYAAYTLYAFELNVRASMILGLVGAGGIGMVLEAQRSTFEYPRVTLIVLAVLVVVLLIEQVSTAIRRRLT